MGKFLHDYMLWAAILSLVVLSIVVVWMASGDAYGDHDSNPAPKPGTLDVVCDGTPKLLTSEVNKDCEKLRYTPATKMKDVRVLWWITGKDSAGKDITKIWHQVDGDRGRTPPFELDLSDNWFPEDEVRDVEVIELVCVETQIGPRSCHPRTRTDRQVTRVVVPGPNSDPTPTSEPTTDEPTQPTQPTRRGGGSVLDCDAPQPYPGPPPVHQPDCDWAREQNGGTP